MLKRNVARHFLVFVVLMGIGLAAAYRLLG
jgi:hypothetical protein